MDDIKRLDIVAIELNSGNLHRSWLNHSIGSGDIQANAFGVDIFRDGQAVNLGGGSVQGYFRDPQGNNIAITTGNTISGNRAYVVLPQACYNYEGQFTLAIKVIGGGVTGTMRIVDGIVDNTNTGSAVAPTGTVPTYQEVLAVYDQMVAAKDGSVRFDITQSLTAAQKAKAISNIGAATEEELDSTKNALNIIESAAEYAYSITGNIGTTGVLAPGATQYRSTDFIPINSKSSILLLDIYTGSSTLAYAFYKADQTFISGQNSIVSDQVIVETIPSNAAYVRFSGRVDDGSGNTWNPQAFVYNFKKMEEDIAENKGNIVAVDAKTTGTKNDFSNMERAAKYNYSITGLINTSGVLAPTYTEYRATDFIACDQDSAIAIYDFYTGSSSLAYAFYDASKGFISGQNSLASDKAFVQTIPSNAAYVRFSSKLTNGSGTSITPKAVVYNFKGLKEEIAKLSPLMPTYSFPYTTGQFINTNGQPATNADYAITDFILCDDAAYVKIEDIYVGASALGYAFYDKDKNFISGQNSISGDIVVQTIPSNAKYIRSSCRVKEGTSTIHSPVITVYNNRTLNTAVLGLLDDVATLKNSGSNLKDLQILIFGDSITDTQNITIDASTNKTTAYSEKIPNNSYTKNGQTISYYMWPNLIRRVLDVKEMRNYALAGAHFYTPSQTPSNPRIKLLYQVQVALNDLSNPNGVFPNNDFSPDIVIVACGINDGNIASGAFESAMNKTIMKSGDTGVDVQATMNNLNQSNPLEAMRYVCMLLKQEFPTALFLYVNPLQQTYSTNEARLAAREELRKMAEQYDFINLDGFGQFGVVRDFETQEEVGLLTKDGLHPNEKGQNLYARNIVQAIKRFYFPLNQFNA